MNRPTFVDLLIVTATSLCLCIGVLRMIDIFRTPPPPPTLLIHTPSRSTEDLHFTYEEMYEIYKRLWYKSMPWTNPNNTKLTSIGDNYGMVICRPASSLRRPLGVDRTSVRPRRWSPRHHLQTLHT